MSHPCIDCNKSLPHKETIRCKPCHDKFAVGKNAHHYIDGRTRDRICPQCNKKPIKGFYSKICKSCSTSNFWKKFHRDNPGIFAGENNYNFKPNKEFRPYPLGWTKTFKEQIRYRDGYICQNCGKPEIECKVKLHVHHIDYNKNNLDLYNLISLCHSCHAKTTVTNPEKIKYWINYYRELVCRKNYQMTS